MIDLHVHTHHSCDARDCIEDYCKKAIDIGVECICFTEHVDYNPADSDYGHYQPGLFFDEINRARDKYSDKLRLLSGVEFGEPHIYQKEFDACMKMPFDFILGSVHWIGDMLPNEMVKNKFPLHKAFEKYWEEMYALVSYGGFDSVAHLDFPKRYFKASHWSGAQLTDIFSEMVKNNLALEINTSSLRKGLAETMPGQELLELYEKTGGTKVTYGSDAHSVSDLAAGYKQAHQLIAGKLESTIYIERKPSAVKNMPAL